MIKRHFENQRRNGAASKKCCIELLTEKEDSLKKLDEPLTVIFSKGG